MAIYLRSPCEQLVANALDAKASLRRMAGPRRCGRIAAVCGIAPTIAQRPDPQPFHFMSARQFALMKYAALVHTVDFTLQAPITHQLPMLGLCI
jgi:hypothetical protein